MLTASAFVSLVPLLPPRDAPVARCRGGSSMQADLPKPPTHTRRAALRILAFGAALGQLQTALAEIEDVRPGLKVSGGSASTSTTGHKTVTKTVTRGVNLEGADFSNSNFEGVSFQQSILRQAVFTGAVLRNASFFDADLAGASFRGADCSGCNFELANLTGADLTDANLSGAYISSSTRIEGVRITNSDWSETLLRKDQQRYLCNLADGTNSKTDVGTKESLFCPL